MNIDTDHLHHWMQAIRQSSDPMRTMDAFWSGQLKSKEWLINNLRSVVTESVSVDIHGGWVGVFASMLFQSGLPITDITSIDIDPSCEKTATTMNQIEFEQGRFRAVTADMCDYVSKADIIINTSCEHITQSQYDTWLDNLGIDRIIVVQSNNYQIPEHIRISNSLDEFISQSNLDIIWAGELELPLYKRFMLIGK